MRVNVKTIKVPIVKPKFSAVLSNGWNMIIAAAATNPELAAVIPSKLALTPRYFFKFSQNLITKKIKNVPGRKIPNDAATAPMI